MITEEQLKKIKPFQDIQNRMRTMKGQVKHHSRKLHLTKQQRNFALWNAVSIKGGGPKHFREIRNG